MPCPHCASPTTVRQPKTSALGYPTFRCGACRRRFNERTGTPFNLLEYPTDIVLLVVLWRLRYKLSLRDLAMAHGFSATRQMMADTYAEVLHAAGLAVLLYDHCGFGASGGEPRRQINPWIQARGYRDAMSYGSDLDGVDPSRVALWGDSLSGRVALAVAGVGARVAVLAIQVPAIGAELPPADPDGSLYRAFRETMLSGVVEAS